MTNKFRLAQDLPNLTCPIYLCGWFVLRVHVHTLICPPPYTHAHDLNVRKHRLSNCEEEPRGDFRFCLCLNEDIYIYI